MTKEAGAERGFIRGEANRDIFLVKKVDQVFNCDLSPVQEAHGVRVAEDN